MTGIAAYGAYVPFTRLPLALIAGRPAVDGGPEKAVAYTDEDSVTMAVAAAVVDCESNERQLWVDLGPSIAVGFSNPRLGSFRAIRNLTLSVRSSTDQYIWNSGCFTCAGLPRVAEGTALPP